MAKTKNRYFSVGDYGAINLGKIGRASVNKIKEKLTPFIQKILEQYFKCPIKIEGCKIHHRFETSLLDILIPNPAIYTFEVRVGKKNLSVKIEDISHLYFRDENFEFHVYDENWFKKPKIKKNMKYSHFENTTTNAQVKSAKVDGYHFGDRLLEGVMFIITVQEDGTLKAETDVEAKEYMDDLNEAKWLKEAVKYAEQNDIFYGMNTKENFVLIEKTDKV